MPFHLAATAALCAWASRGQSARMVNWIHDFAVINPDYDLQKVASFLEVIAPPPASVRHVAVSESRRQEFARATGVENCVVIPNGMDPIEVLQLTPPVGGFLRSAGWPNRWPLLFHPTRLLRRKNVELGIAVAAALRATGERPLYIVTGATDPHHAPSRDYADSIRSLVREAGLADLMFIVHDHFAASADADVGAFYRGADACFIPAGRRDSDCP